MDTSHDKMESHGLIVVEGLNPGEEQQEEDCFIFKIRYYDYATECMVSSAM